MWLNIFQFLLSFEMIHAIKERNPRAKSALAAVAGLLAITCQPAFACSFSWAPGHSPEEIPLRDDVWVVKGDFSFIDAKTGQVVKEGSEFYPTSDTSEMLGHIVRKGQKPILVKQHYSELSVECGAYKGPPGNVSGRFWLSQERDKDGRYRLMLWKPLKERKDKKRRKDSA